MHTGFLTRRRLDREQLVPRTRRLRLRLRRRQASAPEHDAALLNLQGVDAQQLQSMQDIRLLRRAKRWGVAALPEDFAACSRIFHPVLTTHGRRRLTEAIVAGRRARIFAGAMILIGFASLVFVSLS